MPGQPEAIFIIRHGEKPSDDSTTYLAADADAATTADSTSADASSKPTGPFGVDLNGNQDPNSLIPQGWQRAGGLVTLFDPVNAFITRVLMTPTVIGVPKYGTPSNHRTFETVLPLAQKLSIEPTVTVPVGSETELASWILAQSGVVLVCWEHDHIQDLTTALAPVIGGGDVPGPWPSNRFDIVVALSPSLDNKYLCIQVPELLLAGDSLDVIPPAG